MFILIDKIIFIFFQIPKLRCFSLKTVIDEDLEFLYLKWLLNNVNYVEKLQVYLKNEQKYKLIPGEIWKSLIDANFIRQYCLPDTIINLIHFDFYICSECQLSLDDLEEIINSFKIHSFFISHQWTNVKCLFDPIMSCQHVVSCFCNKFQFSQNLICVSPLYGKPLYLSFYLFLEWLNDLYSNVSCIRVEQGK